MKKISALVCKKHCFQILHGGMLRHAWQSETFWYCEVQTSFLVTLMQRLSKSITICNLM